MKTKLILTKYSEDGRLALKREQPSRSWLKHFFDLWYEPLAYNFNTLTGINDITGVARNLNGVPSASGAFLQVGSPPGNVAAWLACSNSAFSTLYNYNALTVNGLFHGDDIGIVIGSGGGTPVTPIQDALTTKIIHGETAGTILYGGTECIGLTINVGGGTAQFTVRRYFTNVLGGALSVSECGIYSVGSNSGTGYAFCIARDVFGAITVNNGELLSVSYVVQIAV